MNDENPSVRTELVRSSLEDLRRRSQFLQIYTAGILFLSTFLLYYWWLVPGHEVKWTFVVVLQIVPVCLNIASWAIWFLNKYMSLVRIGRYKYNDEKPVSSLSNESDFVRDYEKEQNLARVLLKRDTRLGMLITILVGFQMIAIGVVSVAVSMYSF